MIHCFTRSTIGLSLLLGAACGAPHERADRTRPPAAQPDRGTTTASATPAPARTSPSLAAAAAPASWGASETATDPSKQVDPLCGGLLPEPGDEDGEDGWFSARCITTITVRAGRVVRRVQEMTVDPVKDEGLKEVDFVVTFQLASVTFE
jgi:hypothetical protein